MKILTMASYAYFKDKKGFVKNNSGFAYAVSDTCEALVNRGDEVYLLTQSAITKGFSINGIHIVRKKWSDILFNLKLSDFRYALKLISGRKIGIKNKLKTIYYCLNRGYAERVVQIINPDVIHIQSISDYTYPFMLAAANSEKPFIVSNHGLGTFLPNIEKIVKKREGEFFRIASQNGTVVTCVSSGIKERIKDYYEINVDNVIVIPNSYNPVSTLNNLQSRKVIRKKLGVSEKAFVFICVGSISERKNQVQVVRAFRILKESHPNLTVNLIFAGGGSQFDYLQRAVCDNNLTESVILLGNVPHNEIENYYSASDCTVMASIDEGFGLQVIEGYSYGLPSVFFKDLDAAKDLFFDCTAVLSDRGDKSLADGMLKAIETKWDAEEIKKISSNFSKEKMGNSYHDALSKGVAISSSIPYKEIENLISERG